ncbi:transcriptional repressor LexA [Falsiroseomonas selenitidurans]|uniref:LexA repressor n=1 Tax=Falsiroseomonas selenitidurans TaxID=2716335 RepID=A0ABX1E4H3_9PROT|nr:transcriptional repressor LexA [Falsiroseomonas selenitidurans]NKC30412.1 transcriptional repressor LexA [Falsiroseomonas selenitidurans]
MLTRKQHELLMFIDKHLRATGFSPSFEEMKDALRLKSKSGIHRLITALEERGFLKRRAHRARALEVVRLPESMAPRQAAPPPPPAPPAQPAFVPNVIRGHFAPGLAGVQKAANEAGSVALPLYGRIAAGLPIEATRDTAMVDVPATLLSGGEHYALEVAGDSMMEAGILDGDTVIIRRGDTAENGSIVVALVDDQEVTLKRLRRRGNSVALEPANRAYETRIFGPDRVRVQGRLIGLLRKY